MAMPKMKERLLLKLLICRSEVTGKEILEKASLQRRKKTFNELWEMFESKRALKRKGPDRRRDYGAEQRHECTGAE